MIAFSNFSRSKRAALTFALLASLAACSTNPAAHSSAKAGWQIDVPNSNLSFVTTKAGTPGVGGVTELMSFKRYNGGMDAQGKISLDIDLASVESGIALRNERMTSMLWDVKVAPQANFSAQIKPELLKAIGTGSQTIDVEGQLKMAGKSNDVIAKLNITPLAGGKLMVSTREPITVNASDFGLRSGVEALRNVMGLNFISTSAPVSFQLELKAL